MRKLLFALALSISIPSFAQKAHEPLTFGEDITTLAFEIALNKTGFQLIDQKRNESVIDLLVIGMNTYLELKALNTSESNHYAQIIKDGLEHHRFFVIGDLNEEMTIVTVTPDAPVNPEHKKDILINALTWNELSSVRKQISLLSIILATQTEIEATRMVDAIDTLTREGH